MPEVNAQQPANVHSPLQQALNSKIDAKAPENLNNYLSKITEAKAEYMNLCEEINSLKAHKESLVLDNSELFKSHREKIKAQQEETEVALTNARKILADAKKKSLDIDDFHKDLIEKQTHHSMNVSMFEAGSQKKLEDIKQAQISIDNQREKNAADSKSISTQKDELDKKREALKIKESEQINLQDQLNNQALKNASDKIRHEQALNAIQEQSDRIHKEIEEEKLARIADAKKIKELLDKIENEKKENIAILNEITQKHNSIQDKIINLKLLSIEIDKKNTALICQQERITDMNNKLEILKNEVLKEENAK